MKETREQRFDKIIEVKNVKKIFDDVTVIDDMNLSIRRGQFVTLLGPSGCGKTTLLRMIAGFIMPTSGSILIEGQDVTEMPPYKRPVNTVFQKYALFPHLSVYENIAFAQRVVETPTRIIKKKVPAALSLVGLAQKYKSYPKELSGGEAQTTNNRMELTGVITALEALKEPCTVELYSDSKYVIDGLAKGWAKGWRARGWVKSDKKPALNPDLWGRLLDLCDYHTVHLHWVKGHAENPYNNRCDQLAVAESQKYK